MPLLRSTPRASASLSLPHLLRAHLNHASNARVLLPLLGAASAMGEGFSFLLRLLCPALFFRGYSSFAFCASSGSLLEGLCQLFGMPLRCRHGRPRWADKLRCV